MSSKRHAGTGHLYEKWDSYYGRWRTLDGRLLNRKVGPLRSLGGRTGLTRAQAERAFRRMQDEEEDTPRPLPGAHVPTVDEVIDSLRDRLELRGASRSYRENCEYMQRVHISPALGSREAVDVSTADVEVLVRSLLKKGLADKSVRNMMGFLHSAFEHAIDRGWSRENPVRRAEKPGRLRAGTNSDLQFLTISELEAVIRAIPDEAIYPKPKPTRKGRRGPAPPPSSGCARASPARGDPRRGDDRAAPVRAARVALARRRLGRPAYPGAQAPCARRAFHARQVGAFDQALGADG